MVMTGGWFVIVLPTLHGIPCFFLQESPDCGAAGEVRDCHKSSFINESAELRLLCSDEGWDRKGSGDRTDESARLMMASCLINGLRIAKSQAY